MPTNGDLRVTVQELTVEVAVLRERLHEHKLTASKALELQAKEYERRLDDLNHAHQQARETLQTYLPREIHDKEMRDLSIWQRSVDTDRASNQGRTSAVTTILAILLSVVSIIAVAWNAIHR